MVKETIKYRKENNVLRNDFLDIMIQLKSDDFTDFDVTAQCATFFADGYETSSTVMSFALFELACNLHTQSKLREEIRDIVGKIGDEMTFEALNSLPYLDAVINETLRKYPPVKWIGRVCTEDYVYHSDESSKFEKITINIDKGTVITIPVWGMAYDSTYFKEPDKFDPERFLPGNSLENYVHLPFGEGPRQCLGKRFGLLQIKIGIVEIIKNFELQLNSQTELPLKFDPFYVILTPLGGLWADFSRNKEN